MPDQADPFNLRPESGIVPPPQNLPVHPPAVLTVVATLQSILGLQSLIRGLFVFAAWTQSPSRPFATPAFFWIILLTISITAFLSSAGILQRRRWAWRSTCIIQLLYALYSVYGWWTLATLIDAPNNWHLFVTKLQPYFPFVALVLLATRGARKELA